ncbi:SET domain-containing protein [Bimuria novae-zelandiae CBS 107.79]|uniref:SET domain-containing protein n=1 Tax=Bimuria novae-zelandiae CBS 107.79 TaxID=1447943 RepID=A0A6A5V3T0_9PLEO|nr:SET domain-containing protein [Bimuria novae-zelandiae CBS 107.79]
MGVSATTHNKPVKPTGVTKRRSTLRRGSLRLRRTRSQNRQFHYTTPDGVTQVVKSNGTGPELLNDYTLTPSEFLHEPYPSTFPPGGVWPPRKASDILCALGTDYMDCVGSTCYTSRICTDYACTHTLSAWKAATSDWEQHFELRHTGSDRGIGVFTKRSFRRGDILGWYAGEIKPLDSIIGTHGGYLMEIELGDLTPRADAPSVYIDAKKKGNWTRFINHSCEADCVFRIMRVGGVRVMVVEAVRDVRGGEELSVDYGREYYGVETRLRCACGARGCVERKRVRGKGKGGSEVVGRWWGGMVCGFGIE